MNDPTIIAAAIVTVLAALVTGTVTILNAAAAATDRRDGRRSRAAIETTTNDTSVKADRIIEKATEIHTLADGNLSKVTEALNIALEKISGLEKIVAALTKNAPRDARKGDSA